MEDQSGIRLRWPVAVAAAVALVGIGGGAAYLTLSGRGPSSLGGGGSPVSKQPAAGTMMQTPAEPRAVDRSAGSAPLPDVAVPLTEDGVARAGIEIVTVGTSASGASLRITGTVQPNAYRSVVVTPLVAGRVLRVAVELGQHVSVGQTLAEIYSPELAEAQTRYLSSTAELSAHEQQLRRTEKLVEIGAASRQELEKIHAEHTGATTIVESNRARLTLLGMTETDIARLAPSQLNSAVRIASPVNGVITTRDANAGMNVEPSSTLFTVVDLSSVWVTGDLYERDFSSVHVGSRAIVTTTAYPNQKWEGKVSYIDPQVKAETRTAQVRVEVPNPKGELRLGMYAEMQMADTMRSGSGTVTIPRSAVQVVSDRSVVYVVNPQERGRFIEREVRLGDASGEDVQVLSGVHAGDVVVSKGSFSIRAERERLGLRPPPSSDGLRAAREGGASMPAPAGVSAAAQAVRITVGDQGYEPDHVSLRAGVPARLTFVRTSDKTCGTEVTIPSLNIKRALPLNQPVDIELTPTKGEIAFVCGMGMLKGTIVGQ